MLSIQIKTDFKKGLEDLNKFRLKLSRIEMDYVRYGYFDGKIHKTEFDKDNITEARLMFTLEFGSEQNNIPPRPVFTRTIETFADVSNSNLLVKPVQDFLYGIANNKNNIKSVLKDMGEILKKETQDNFGFNSAVILTPNHPMTVLLKGRNDPLVHTGTLRNNMEVRTSGE